MYDPPAYLWALIIAGTSAIAVATCVALYGGAMRGHRPARARCPHPCTVAGACNTGAHGHRCQLFA